MGWLLPDDYCVMLNVMNGAFSRLMSAILNDHCPISFFGILYVTLNLREYMYINKYAKPTPVEFLTSTIVHFI